MDKFRRNIVVLEPSAIVYEGLYASISKSEYNYSFFCVDSFTELETLIIRKEISVVLINPVTMQNRTNEFKKLKSQYPEIRWIGIIYAFHDNAILKLFDSIFKITDDISVIIRKINKISGNKTSTNQNDEHLSEREVDVLRCLAKGLSNKETADTLNVSIHTINSHRKNIMDKTGIRSLAGLTIYAVTQNIISID
jgi:DNA-binding CsgD family transcriptional regulator